MRKIVFDFLRVKTLRTIFELDTFLEWIRHTYYYYYNRQRGVAIILSTGQNSSHITWLHTIPPNMRKNTERQAMTKLSIYLPVRSVESVEKCRGYYSLNRWIWKAIDKALEEEEKEKIAIKA